MRQGTLIAGTGTVLAGLLAWQLAAPPEPVPEAEARPPRAAPVLPGTAAAASASASPELAQAAATALARPLFSRDRRPSEEKARAPAEAVAAKDILPRLSGVLVSPAGRRAVFAEASGRSRSAGEGEALGRYMIRAILPGMVVLSGPEGEKVLYTTHAKSPGAEAASQ